jgi:lipid II:glycine glycyltransferase (peptidoglycan interpeptide bridge formation enzyme)
MFETLTKSDKGLKAHLFFAKYQDLVLTAWMLFVFKDTLYYPYGASTRQHREVMAQNLMMWEAIRFGKKLRLKKFDLWGSLGENPDPKDPWIGFHKFKLGYNPRLVTFMGSYDLVINTLLYKVFILGDKLRWTLLKIKSRIFWR